MHYATKYGYQGQGKGVCVWRTKPEHTSEHGYWFKLALEEMTSGDIFIRIL